MATAAANRTARLLSTLHHFNVDRENARSFHDTPKGASSSSLSDLIEAKLIEAVNETSPGRQRYATSAAGKAVLALPDPASGLPEFVSWWDRMSDEEQARMEQALAPCRAMSTLRDPQKAMSIRPAEPLRPDTEDRPRSAKAANLVYPPRGLSRADAARYIGISTTKFDEMVRDGRMPHPKRIDARKVWDRHALDESFENLPTDGEKIDEGRWQVDL